MNFGVDWFAKSIYLVCRDELERQVWHVQTICPLPLVDSSVLSPATLSVLVYMTRFYGSLCLKSSSDSNILVSPDILDSDINLRKRWDEVLSDIEPSYLYCLYDHSCAKITFPAFWLKIFQCLSFDESEIWLM